MKKYIIVLLLVILFGVAVVGCGISAKQKEYNQMVVATSDAKKNRISSNTGRRTNENTTDILQQQ